MSCSVNAMLYYSSVGITCGCLTLWKKKDLNFPMFSRWIWKTQSQAHLNKTQKSSLQIDKEAPLLIWKWGCSKQKSSRSNFFPNQVTDHNHCSVFAIRKVTFCDDSGTCTYVCHQPYAELRWSKLHDDLKKHSCWTIIKDAWPLCQPTTRHEGPYQFFLQQTFIRLTCTFYADSQRNTTWPSLHNITQFLIMW